MITSSAEASVAIKVVNGGEIADSFSLHSFQNGKKKKEIKSQERRRGIELITVKVMISYLM